MPLMRGKDQILSLLRFLEKDSSAVGKKRIYKATVGEFVQQAPRTGLALVISDLYDQEGFREGVDRLRYARFEPHVVQIHTPYEAEPNFLGDVQLVDCEYGTGKEGHGDRAQTASVQATVRKFHS